VAEQRLSGCKAQDRRVTAEWLKTPEVVVSTDQSNRLDYLDASGKLVGDLPR